MKKEEDVETNGGGRKGQKKKEIALPGFHIESLRSSGTFTPSPPLSSSPASSLLSTHPILPPSATSSDIKLFIVHNGASSFVKSKKKKKKYKWKKPARRREPWLRGKGVLRQICRSPSSVSSPGRLLSSSLLSCFLPSLFFYSERGSMTGGRSIPRRFTAKRGSETRNTDGNLHS